MATLTAGTTVRNLMKTFVSLEVGLGVSSILMSNYVTSHGGLYDTPLYPFFMTTVFGFPIYIPFLLLHSFFSFLSYSFTPHSWVVGLMAIISGSILAALFSIAAPNYTSAKVMDALSFGIGGGIYGWLAVSVFKIRW